MLTDERYFQIMESLGLPNSLSLLLALKQCAMEAALLERDKMLREQKGIEDEKLIVETDNFNGDYPNEKFLRTPSLNKKDAEIIANILNNSVGDYHPRYWKVVDLDYKLIPGFEP